ncbi:Mco8 protein [Saccharomycopsis crataegensis]|uniref:Mco8 protein n=1 Tax=Saccharomycopsis crataegensis TaxID=43959 RepID=A0AAV5QTE8_9ASCO|nr:Mco8 protein [Saccharomycopsis crataegensis]
MPFLGRAFHISVDLVLASAFLAGIKRSTGLTPNLDQFDDNLIKEYGAKYLNVGEYVFDASVGYFTTSTYFKRK